MMDRGALQQVGIYADEPFDSYFSGNVVQICPVGALTGASYRFRARPFDLVSSPGVCEHCASGCAQRTDHRRGKVLRRMAGDDPEVNEEWNCDKGRWAFTYATRADRITTPLVRDTDGTLVPTSWPNALALAARGLIAAHGRVGTLVGGRVSTEDAYAYSKFARIALNTNDIDFRARAHSPEEAQFLTARIAGGGIEVSYANLEAAPVVLLAGFEPEEESPIVFLRLRKAARKHGTRVYSVAPFADRGLDKMLGTLVTTTPGGEAAALEELRDTEIGRLLGSPGAVIMAGERLAAVAGGLSAAVRLADATGAKLAWVPRRAGERGALDAGALGSLLPGGRPVTDADAREQVAQRWGVDGLPSTPGRDSSEMLAAAAEKRLAALIVAGVDPDDLADPGAAHTAVQTAGFVVSLEIRASAVTERADVVFPVAAVDEKDGTFITWEGRGRRFGAALRDTAAVPDLRVLDALAAEMGVVLGLPTTAAARDELRQLGGFAGARPPAPDVAASPPPELGVGEAVLASWRMLLDAGRLQDGEPHLAGTARTPVARLSAATAAEIGAADGETVTVSTSRGAIGLPLRVTEMVDRVVWLPMNSPGCAVHAQLGVTAGAVVTIGASA
jgi:NADH-quinone oxidoreductase subunit G